MASRFIQFGRRLPVFFVLLLGVFSFQSAFASSVIEVGLEEMAAASELVFEGRVVDATARWTADGESIRTYVTFEVLDVIKGSAGPRVTLSFLGGTIGELSLRVSDLNRPVPGEKGIYFVESMGAEQVNPLYGWAQGHFILVRDPAGGGELVLTGNALPVVGLDTAGPQSKRRTLSRGVAGGVKTAEPARVSQAIGKRAFKETLRTLVFTG